jgi:hypothetical protein
MWCTGFSNAQNEDDGGKPEPTGTLVGARSSQAALRRQQLNSSAGPNPQRLKSGSHLKWRKNCRDQYDTAVPFIRVTVNLMGMPLQIRGDSSIPASYLE